MKTNIFLFLVLVTFAFSANAQDKKTKIGLGPAVSMPTGNFGDINSVGVGADLTAAYALNETIELFGQFGFHYFTAKKIDFGFGTFKTDPITHFPFLAGARIVKSNIIAGAGLGYGIYKDMSGFTFSPQVGYRTNKIDIILNYTSTSIQGSNLGYFGLKTAYNF